MVILSVNFGDVVDLLTVICIFIFVILLTYFCTHWIAKYQKGQMLNKNIKVIETYKLTPNKYIQIVQIGTKYVSIAISKDTVTKLVELEEEEILEMPNEKEGAAVMGVSKDAFLQVLERVKSEVRDKGNKREHE